MGGAEHVLVALLEHMPRESVDPLLVCSESGNLIERARQNQIPVLVEPLQSFASTSRIWGDRVIADPFALLYDLALIVYASRRVAKRLRQERVDLIHTNTFFAHLYGGLAAKRLGIPCVWHLHDVIQIDRFGGLAGRIWRRLGCDLATRVVGSSNCAVEAFAGLAIAQTIYAGIETDYVPRKDWTGWRQELGLGEDAILVGFVRRLDWTKGLDILARAAKTVVAQNPRVHFIIIGTPLFGDQAYAAEVTRQVDALGLRQHWHQVGYLPGVAHQLHDLDCLVLPSRRESFPRVLLEAGIAGKPAVASNVGGVSEIIENGVNGILVPPQNPEALANALIGLLANDQVMRSMGANAKTRIITEFNIGRSASQFVELYQKIQLESKASLYMQSPNQLDNQKQ